MIEHLQTEPYVGARPFETADRSHFFGRSGETNDVVALIVAYRLLLLYAPAGAGKTSLINAGLIPGLLEEDCSPLPVARVGTPSERPNDVRNIFVFSALTSMSGDEPVPDPRLEQMTFAEFLSHKVPPRDVQEMAPPVLILDQLEELFTAFPECWGERRGFFEQLREALDQNPYLRVVLSMKEDHIARLDTYAPILPDNLRIRFRLQRINRDAAIAAVKRPAELAGRRFDQGVAEKLVEDLLTMQLRTPGGQSKTALVEHVEPVQLQVACMTLWDRLPAEQTIITHRDVEVLANVEQALSDFYERCIREAMSETGIKEVVLRRWFEKSLITPAGTRGMVFRGETSTGHLSNEAVVVFENSHLIRGELRNGAVWYELTNDRLIHPILGANKRWLMSLSAINQKLLALEDRASEWLSGGGSDTGLLTLSELPDVEQLLAAEQVETSNVVHSFVAASRAAAEFNSFHT